VITVEPDPAAPKTGAPYFNPQHDLQSAALVQLEQEHVETSH
jgi:DeoR family ulaG and ulaABCDEF operon transcriptional repressor